MSVYLDTNQYLTLGVITMHDHVFVFGSNLAGRHGKGAALTAAKEYGAVYGIGRGPTGWAYAIPTKTASLGIRTKLQIKLDVREFVNFANNNTHIKFKITRVGCGLAGYKDEDIAPMFEGIGDNCFIDPLWSKYLPKAKTF